MRKNLKMTVAAVERLEAVLAGLSDIRQAKLAYAVAKNRASAREILSAVREALMPSHDAMAFEKAREDLLVKHARKDAGGNAVRLPVPDRPNLYQYIIADKVAFEADLTALREEHSAGVASAEDLEKRRTEILSEQETIAIHTLSIDDLKPDEAGDLPITAGQLSVLLELGVVLDGERLKKVKG